MLAAATAAVRMEIISTQRPIVDRTSDAFYIGLAFMEFRKACQPFRWTLDGTRLVRST
jgi:hypothetical protein